MLKQCIRKTFEMFGYSLNKSNGSFEANQDIGRDYKDADNVLPNFKLKKASSSCCCRGGTSAEFTEFSVFNGESLLTEVIYYSHLTLLKMCKHYSFNTVLDIGSHERRCTRIFEHIGKNVTTVEIAPGYEADYHGDYLNQTFEEPFDAIWCSQTYEHQRNPGIFLDKIFEDLKEGGVLGLTVPFQIDKNVCFGHINLTSPLMLIYHLVCAGFDCSGIALKVYNGFIGVILEKKYNGIDRKRPSGSLPLQGQIVDNAKEIIGDEIFDRLHESFPFLVAYPTANNKITSINWGNPI